MSRKAFDKAASVPLKQATSKPDLVEMKTAMVVQMHHRLVNLTAEILDTIDTDSDEGRKTTLDFLKVYASLAPKQSQNENLHLNKDLDQKSDEEILAELKHLRSENDKMLEEQAAAKKARIAHQAHVDEAREAEFEHIPSQSTATARPRSEEEVSLRDE